MKAYLNKYKIMTENIIKTISTGILIGVKTIEEDINEDAQFQTT